MAVTSHPIVAQAHMVPVAVLLRRSAPAASVGTNASSAVLATSTIATFPAGSVGPPVADVLLEADDA